MSSGIHATLAGVVLAMMIPVDNTGDDSHSLLHVMERALWVAFVVLPIFGFANTGVALGASTVSLLSPLPLGIVVGHL